MPYENPGAAAGQGIFDALSAFTKAKMLQQQHDLELQKLQADMENAKQDHALKLQEMNMTLDLRRQQQQEKEKADALKGVDERYIDGDRLDPSDPNVQKLQKLGIVQQRSTQAIQPQVTGQVAPPHGMEALGTQHGVTQLAQPTQQYFNPAIRMAQRVQSEKDAKQIAYLMSLNPDDPNTKNIALAAGAQNAGINLPASAFTPQPQAKPIYEVDGRTGTVTEKATGKTVTSIPPNAELVHKQYEPASAVDPTSAMTPQDRQGMIDALAKKWVYDERGFAGDMQMRGANTAIAAEAIARAQHYNPQTRQFDATVPPNLLQLRAGYKSDKGAADKQKAAVSAIISFADAASNTATLLDTVEHPDTGMKLANIPVRAVIRQFGGLGDYDAYIRSLNSEYAKLITAAGQLGMREVSVGMQKKMDEIMDPNTPFSRVQSALKALKAEGYKREDSYVDQYNRLMAPYGVDELLPKRAHDQASGSAPAPAGTPGGYKIRVLKK